MGRHQHGQAQRLRESIRGVRVRELAGGKLRLVDEPDRRRTQRSQHQAAQPAHLRRQLSRKPPVAGEHPHRRRRVQRGQSHEDTGHRRRRRPESARRTERCRRRRAEADRRCPRDLHATRSMPPPPPGINASPISATARRLNRATRRRRGSSSITAIGAPYRAHRERPGMSWYTAVARAITRPAGRPRADAPFRRRRVRDRMASPNVGAARLVRPSSEKAGRGRRSSTTTRVSCERLDSRPTPPWDKQRERRSSPRLIRESESPSLASPASRARVRLTAREFGSDASETRRGSDPGTVSRPSRGSTRTTVACQQSPTGAVLHARATLALSLRGCRSKVAARLGGARRPQRDCSVARSKSPVWNRGASGCSPGRLVRTIDLHRPVGGVRVGEARGDRLQIAVASLGELTRGAACCRERTQRREFPLATEPLGVTAAGDEDPLELRDRRDALAGVRIDEQRLDAISCG